MQQRTNVIPVCDLHCDLLSYLAYKEDRTPFHEEARCSFPQMKRGNLCFQALAIFAETKKGSTIEGAKQVAAYRKLVDPFIPLKSFDCIFDHEKVCILPAFEGCSTFAEEDEPLATCLERFDTHCDILGPVLYASLTWNTENRFGGGNHSQLGLKQEGRELLQHMEGKVKAIDLSHTSDRLATDILNFIDKKGLTLVPIASHSNFRVIKDHPRNLSNSIAKEIIRRNGVIGINLFRHFVGENFADALMKIVDHARELGGEKNLCFGADFFYDQDFDTALSYGKPFFDPDFGDSSCYPRILRQLENHFSRNTLDGIAYKNFQAFLKR